MCLQAQGVDEEKGIVNRVRWPHGISDNNGGVGRVRVIDNASEGLETTTDGGRCVAMTRLNNWQPRQRRQ